MAICGIYGIHDELTDEWYIGQSRDIYRRWREHSETVNDSLNDWHQKLNKNPERYTFKILSKCSPEDLDDEESYWIYEKNSVNKGLNKKYGNHDPFKSIQKSSQSNLITNDISNIIIENVHVTENNGSTKEAQNILNFNPSFIFNNYNLNSNDYDILLYYIYTTQNKLEPYCYECMKFFHKTQDGGYYNSYSKSVKKLQSLKLIQLNNTVCADIMQPSPKNITIDFQKYSLVRHDKSSKYVLYIICLIEYLKLIKQNTILLSTFRTICSHEKMSDIIRYAIKPALYTVNEYYSNKLVVEYIKKGHSYDKFRFVFSND